MSRFWRAIVVSAVATAAAGAAWTLVSRWSQRAIQAGEGVARLSRQRSREDLVDDLNDDQQQQLLDELSRHV